MVVQLFFISICSLCQVQHADVVFFCFFLGLPKIGPNRCTYLLYAVPSVASLLLLGYDAAASSNIVCNTSSVT